ncbi:unnamed protein product [Phyllotreta striolata]|uniref:Uncharacterized protein n=1 Tax=Phyllotreta striolata TaxID=444603 RepID=A0A9N9TLJ8_PHYSR|nr:unnamed protein product [Phyllotreta striolata]
MGKAFSRVKTPFKNFDLENRAHKIISRDKPTPAPRYEKDQNEYERVMKEYPKVYEESLQKNLSLDKRLKQVFVVSEDADTMNIKQSNPNRPLPTDRRQVQSFLYGVKVPDKIPLGKATLGSVLEFLSLHQGNPVKYNAKNISEKYNLAEDTVSNILKYFKVFQVYIPVERNPKAKFAGPSIPQIKVIKPIIKELPSDSSKDKS